MSWQDFTSLLPNVAKVLTSGLPFSGAISSGIDAISSLLGIDAKDPIALAKAVEQVTPEQQIKLKQLDADIFASEVKDRESARQMEIENKKTNVQSGRKYSVPEILAFMVTFSFLSYIFLIMTPWVSLNGADKEMFTLLIGGLAATVAQIISFYFGDSHSRYTNK